MKDNSYQNEDFNDLCVTCKNYSTCLYIKNASRPIHYCEEFENYAFRPVKESSNPVKSDTKEEKLVFHGLCKNCGNRMTCMNASPERIIWHCEEYV